MSNLFEHISIKTLLRLNVFSVLILLVCEIFAIFTFITKGSDPELERWKYLAIIGGIVVVSVFLIAASATLVFFFIRMRKNKKN